MSNGGTSSLTVNGSGSLVFANNITTSGSQTYTVSTSIPSGSATLAGTSISFTSLTISGGSLTIGSSSSTTASIDSLTFSSGTLAGSAVVTISAMNWTGGLMSGAGTTTMSGSGVFSMVSGAATYGASGAPSIARTVTVGSDATLTIYRSSTASNYYIYINSTTGNVGNLTNNGTINIDHQTTAGSNYYLQFTYVNAAGTITNSGTINVDLTGSGASTSSYVYNNVSLANTSGTMKTAATSTTSQNSAWLQYGSGSISGTSYGDQGWWLQAGSTTSISGSLYLRTGATSNSQAIVVNGGTLNTGTSTSATIIVEGLDFISGTITGSGTLSLRSKFTWTSGIMSGAGTTCIDNTLLTNIISTGAYYNGDSYAPILRRLLVVPGGATLKVNRGSGYYFNIDNYVTNGILQNEGNLLFTNTDSTYAGYRTILYYFNSPGTINNYGTISATSANSHAIQNIGGSITTIDNKSGGTISATGSNGYAIYGNGGSIGTITNSGIISATGSNGYGIYNYVSGSATSTIGTITNEIGGTISGTSAGINNRKTVNQITNSGTISGAYGIQNSGTITDLTNTGTISGVTYGIQNSGTITDLTNSGTISGGAGSPAILVNSGVITTLTNTGTISGGLYLSGSGAIGTLTNSQGVRNGASLSYTGALPNSYNIIINSLSNMV